MKKKFFLLLGLIVLVVLVLALWRTRSDESLLDTTEDAAAVEDSTADDEASEADPYKDHLDAALEELEQIDR